MIAWIYLNESIQVWNRFIKEIFIFCFIFDAILTQNYLSFLVDIFVAKLKHLKRPRNWRLSKYFNFFSSFLFAKVDFDEIDFWKNSSNRYRVLVGFCCFIVFLSCSLAWKCFHFLITSYLRQITCNLFINSSKLKAINWYNKRKKRANKFRIIYSLSLSLFRNECS